MGPEPARTTTDLETRFRELYDAALPVVYGFVLFRVGRNRELAEDLTAETFAAAVSEFRAGRPEVVTVSWLRTVARRRIIDYWRHQSVVDLNASKLFQRQWTDGAADYVERERVMAALEQIRKSQRRALILQHVEQLTVAEVAAVLGRSEKAVESILSRARVAFRAAYDGGRS
ncbi:MAG: sigma-70 family RNA polymerase sigma factor [Acidimicrobiia bacterium]|nr:sigma-70 family RNA polymerase sigma factor [Acidimicrobiia bacterium]